MLAGARVVVVVATDPFFECLKPGPAIRLLDPQTQGSGRQLLPWAYFPGLAYSPCQSVTGKGHAFLVAHGQGPGWARGRVHVRGLAQPLHC